jgi:NitT/TauT family transport system ATP-binding protein
MSSRPGHITGEVEVDAAYPRGDAFRTSLGYNEFCRQTSAELARAMAEIEEG